MREKIKFRGLHADAYIHPEERKMRIDSDFNLVSKGLDALNDINVSAVKQVTLGRHIEVLSCGIHRVWMTALWLVL